MKASTFLVLALTGLCFCSALGVVVSTHLSREAHAELGLNRAIIDELDVQWSQLQIEEGTFSEYGLIEKRARERLDMVYPGLDGSVMIERQP
jgi:cell division protein FtsL